MSFLPAHFLAAAFTLGLFATVAAAVDRWQLNSAKRIITWDVAKDTRLPHKDWIELSGKKTAAIITYSIDAERILRLDRHMVFPTLREMPNNTHSSFSHDVGGCAPDIFVNGEFASSKVREVRYEQGTLVIVSDLAKGLAIRQTLTPGVVSPGLFEQYEIIAESPETDLQVEWKRIDFTPTVIPYSFVDKGTFIYGKPRPVPITKTGNYIQTIACEPAHGVAKRGSKGVVCSGGIYYLVRKEGEPLPEADFEKEIAARKALAQSLFDELKFECPDHVLSTMFDFSKLRGSDSIIETKGGPMHAPGGGAYYAAIWANDTIEYAGPFYPFVGYAYGNEATLNSMGHFARYMNPQYDPIPSSIIAEGTDIWARRLRDDGLPDWQGDRGDAAMMAYGCSRFLLALGDKEQALKHWPLIEWSLEFCERRKTSEGVIESASDELEGRFSTGKVNLNTSVLTYGGLLSAADLASELGKNDLATKYRQRAKDLRAAIKKMFEADVAGFPTYRYHDGCEQLRAWICIPLTMGIFDRKQGTIDALFSPKLWTDNGILTSEGSTTFWDRSTLYALRGVFFAGEPDAALAHLQALSRTRLLGEHVPYVVEAYPEGNGRHLSAESALYCRVVTEGMFGITPTGFRSFTVKPSLPKAWDKMALRKVRVFKSTFDVEVRRANGKLKLIVSPKGGKVQEFSITQGESVAVKL